MVTFNTEQKKGKKGKKKDSYAPKPANQINPDIFRINALRTIKRRDVQSYLLGQFQRIVQSKVNNEFFSERQIVFLVNSIVSKSSNRFNNLIHIFAPFLFVKVLGKADYETIVKKRELRERITFEECTRFFYLSGLHTVGSSSPQGIIYYKLEKHSVDIIKEYYEQRERAARFNSAYVNNGTTVSNTKTTNGG